MLVEQSLHARGYLRVSELRHGGKQMMLNLEIEVRHEPVHDVEPARLNVRRVQRSVLDPVQKLVRLAHRKMRVRHGKLGKDVGRPDGVVSEVQTDRRAPRHARAQPPVEKEVPQDQRGAFS